MEAAPALAREGRKGRGIDIIPEEKTGADGIHVLKGGR